MPEIDSRFQWNNQAKVNLLGIPNPGDVEEVTVTWSGTQLYQTHDPDDPGLHDLSADYVNGDTYTLDVGVTYGGVGPRHFVNSSIVGSTGQTQSYTLPEQ